MESFECNVDIDVKIVLYGLVAQIDDRQQQEYAQYLEDSRQIKQMYSQGDTSLDTDDDDDSDDAMQEEKGEEFSQRTRESNLNTEAAMVEETSTSEISDDDDNDDIYDLPTSRTIDPNVIMTRNEILPQDLPPVEHLQIGDTDRANLHLQQIGEISSIVNSLVVVECFRGAPPLDLDSVLFLRDKKPLGTIFETFGQVSQPFYTIRLSTDFATSGISLRDPVFFAPSSSLFTRYVFVDVLRSVKHHGDASWEDDNEPPAECLDYSDDEEEVQAKKSGTASAVCNGAAKEGMNWVTFKAQSDQIPGNRNEPLGKAKRKKLWLAAKKTNSMKVATSPPNSAAQFTGDVMSLIQQTVRNNPDIVTDIISSAVTASVGQYVAHTPVVNATNFGVDIQNGTDSASSISTCLPQGVLDGGKRRVDPRFMKKL